MQSNHTEPWAPCAPGTLGTLAAKALGRRQQQRVAWATGAAAAVTAAVVLVGLTLWHLQGPLGQREYYFGGIACREVIGNIEAYRQGQLPDEEASRFRVHLAECPACQAVIKAMEAGQLQPGAWNRRWADCSCLRCRETARSRWPGAAAPHHALGARANKAETADRSTLADRKGA